MISPSGIPLIGRLTAFQDRPAVVSANQTYSYAGLLDASASVAQTLAGERWDLGGKRVAFLVGRGFGWAACLLGIWRAGGIAVPLAEMHPAPELEYYIADSEASQILAGSGFEERLKPVAARLGVPLLRPEFDRPPGPQALPVVEAGRRAMILYTSGTTNRPKGVVTTHAQIAAQINAMVQAWGWRPDDRILHVLPLHHLHGILNLLLCSLWSGAVCEFMPAFNAEKVWERLGQGGLTLFMAVPTIFARLIRAWREFPEEEQKRLSAAAARLRLMVSGSAALPPHRLEEWREITGQVLLERYGMTEIGMGLSNPLEGERRAGSVGSPLPGVEVRLMAEDGQPAPLGTPGEIQVRGPGVFSEYWHRPEATAEAFVGGWFKTGDVAVVEGGRYRILGRESVDIIKTGGYKVSALELKRFWAPVRTCPNARWSPA